MHAGDAYLRKIGKAVNHAVLSAQEAQILGKALQEDSRDSFQAAVVSFVDALRSVEIGFFSWATVKLYYAVFYALRARLSVSGDCIFYIGKSPRLLSAHPGCATSNLTGTTHKAVLSRFQNTHVGDYFLSQEIGGKLPLDWFVEQREQTNYRSARFSEPEAPPHLRFATTIDRRKMLAAYLSDDVYVFDEDHAIIAFPFKLLREVRRSLTTQHVSPLLPVEVDFLKRQMRDRSGSLASVDAVLF